VSHDERTFPEVEDAALAAGKHVVTAHWKGGSASVVFVPGSAVTLGRADQCELVIDHASVSRAHARLRVDEAGLVTVEDLASTNGVSVSGMRLAKGSTVTVPFGATITVGAAIVIVKGPHVPPRSTTAPASAWTDLEEIVRRVAPSDVTVLILGETGAGKGVTAAEVHARSRRADRPLVRLNCAAFPEALLESELFGYERGAFTGAVQSKPGLLEGAHECTVFLDEIGEMSLTTQAKLLTVLDTQDVQRLGSLRPRKINVRFIAATNRDLAVEVKAGRFRRDLYFRLSGVTLTVPPLRDHPERIVPLAELLLDELSTKLHKPRPVLGEDAKRTLTAHAWPGNVRELRNTIERALVMSDPGEPILRDVVLGAFDEADAPASAPVTSEPLTRSSAAGAASRSDGRLKEELTALERQRIVEALDATHGNQTRAAERLGISRRTLIHRMEQYGLPRPRKG
jgi:transcriptional regulator with PAS, ATPase and Fis domain